MAGLVAQTPTELLSAGAATISAGSIVALATVNVDDAVCADLLVEASTDASSTDGLEIYLVKKVDTVEATNKYLLLSVDGGGASEALWFPLEAGTYMLYAKNNDTSYAATVSSAKLKTYVWQ